jgi:hypothetical protein
MEMTLITRTEAKYSNAFVNNVEKKVTTGIRKRDINYP